MADFATVAQLKDYWPDFPVGADPNAEKLLGFASAMMRSKCADADLLDPVITEFVAVDLVKRAMSGPGGGQDVSSMNVQTGPFGEQVTFANPMGGLRLLPSHLDMLGCGRQSAFTVELAGAPVPDPWWV